ncbi:PepSY domain-containing protein [Gemmobacter serpentinus]|uniref:PepSY domain-containing protein n=1 Tax=Gemmobacter serpentinus TaxID=2652247 RepID=UPI00124DF734|nr:PepSY domain-containing protein [Gemmobacter serpentinus]
MKPLILALLCPFFWVLPASADGDTPDHEWAGGAVARGEFLPLAGILSQIAAVQPGRVIEVELEYSDDRYIYEVELVTPDGRLIEVEVDAATGTILQLEEDDDD